MPTVEPRPESVNETTTTPATPPPSPDELLDEVRERIVEARALARIAANALLDLPAGTVPEDDQALAVLCQRTCDHALDALDRYVKEARG